MFVVYHQQLDGNFRFGELSLTGAPCITRFNDYHAAREWANLTNGVIREIKPPAPTPFAEKLKEALCQK